MNKYTVWDEDYPQSAQDRIGSTAQEAAIRHHEDRCSGYPTSAIIMARDEVGVVRRFTVVSKLVSDAIEVVEHDDLWMRNRLAVDRSDPFAPLTVKQAYDLAIQYHEHMMREGRGDYLGDIELDLPAVDKGGDGL